MKKTIALDFDGVLHRYDSKWTTEEVISDGPVEGMAEACRTLLAAGYELVVYSTRAKTESGREAMKMWLEQFDFPPMPCSHEKPLAIIYVDDRAVRFMGSAEKMLADIKRCQNAWNK